MLCVCGIRRGFPREKAVAEAESAPQVHSQAGTDVNQIHRRRNVEVESYNTISAPLTALQTTTDHRVVVRPFLASNGAKYVGKCAT